ncbi:hypothetical protein HDU86_002295 [Geranomyces michiganensis]|nr:hypothetical protein HDU86_002295 [Geranomyces michiganensis]
MLNDTDNELPTPYDSDSSGDDAAAQDPNGARSYRPFNRGNKLKRTLEQPAVVPTKPTLWTVHYIDEEFEFAQLGKRRAIMRKGKRRREEDSPYADINIDELWSMPSTPAEAAQLPSVVHTLRTRSLKILSQSAMTLVEREQEFNKHMSRFAQMLQSDDPLFQNIIEIMGGEMSVEFLEDLQGDLQEVVSRSNEFVKRIGDTRDKLMQAHVQKKVLAKQLLPPERNKQQHNKKSNNNSSSGSGGSSSSSMQQRQRQQQQQQQQQLLDQHQQLLSQHHEQQQQQQHQTQQALRGDGGNARA